MRLRTAALGAAAACVVVGGVVGYAVGAPSNGSSAPFPVAPMSASPSVPVDVPSAYASDTSDPALSTTLQYVRTTVGFVGGSRWSIEVPKGWSAQSSNPPGTVLWRPASYPGYHVRAEPITGARATIATQMAWQQGSMPPGTVTEHSSADTIWFDYRDPESNLHRFNYFTWLTVPGTDFIGLEISVAGREEDVPGLERLLDHVRASATWLTGSNAPEAPASSPSGSLSESPSG